MGFWQGRRVCVTGGAGFVGSHLVELLVEDGAAVTVADDLSRGAVSRLASVWADIRFVQVDVGNPEGARTATRRQEIVLNLAAKVTGIEYNRFHHADMFTSNMRIASAMLEAAARGGVGRFLVVSTACIYPHDAAVPTPESEGSRGTPEPTNEGYGWAKRMAEELGRYYSTESSMQIAICRPFNAYGPRDHWDEATSHVVPALVKRVLDGDNPVEVWGSGEQTRAFLHARDAALGMKLIAERVTSPEPVNIGHDQETSIRELVERILSLTGRSPRVMFDRSRPDGYPRRAADTTRLRAVTGWAPNTDLDAGLTQMIAEFARSRGRLAIAG
ncbi:MAG: NAD-dependent epimerase/dehydratase family protein [Acidobacteria bacterium]|nr:NAD-dependent epimerase/dehydratase family protein [Acidobacteriota bacterium]